MESEKLRNRIKHTRSHVGQQAKGTFGERRLEPILFFILGLNGSAIRFPFITWCCAPLRARHLCPARCGTRSACRVRSRCAEIFFAQPTLTRRQSAISSSISSPWSYAKRNVRRGSSGHALNAGWRHTSAPNSRGLRLPAPRRSGPPPQETCARRR